MSLECGTHTTTRNDFKIAGFRQRDLTGGGGVHHRLGEWVTRASFESRRETQQFVFADPIEGFNSHDFGSSVGQCSSLIEGDHINLGELLEIDAAFDENTSSCGTSHSRDDHQWCRQSKLCG